MSEADLGMLCQAVWKDTDITKLGWWTPVLRLTIEGPGGDVDLTEETKLYSASSEGRGSRPVFGLAYRRQPVLPLRQEVLRDGEVHVRNLRDVDRRGALKPGLGPAVHVQRERVSISGSRRHPRW